MTESIHKICAICKTVEWEVPVCRDPLHTGKPDYEKLMAQVEKYIEAAQGICPDCEKRLAEQKVASAAKQILTGGMEAAIRSGCIWEDTTRCTFALSDPLKEAVNAQAWQTARELAHDERFTRHRSVMLKGAPGRGKTFLGRCLLNAAGEDRGYGQVCEMTARQYIHAVIRNDPQVWTAQRGFFLLLDDLDKAAWTPNTLQMLWELLDLRTHGKFTAVTSNLDDRGLMEMLRDACPKNTSLADATMERLNPCLHLAIAGDVSFRRTTAAATEPVTEPEATAPETEEELF